MAALMTKDSWQLQAAQIAIMQVVHGQDIYKIFLLIGHSRVEVEV